MIIHFHNLKTSSCFNSLRKEKQEDIHIDIVGVTNEKIYPCLFFWQKIQNLKSGGFQVNDTSVLPVLKLMVLNGWFLGFICRDRLRLSGNSQGGQSMNGAY